MKKLFIYSLVVGIFLFTLYPVFAQATEPLVNPNTDKGQSDSKSEEILKKVAAIYKGYKIVVTNAMPYPKSGISIKERDYKVEFKIFK